MTWRSPMCMRASVLSLLLACPLAAFAALELWPSLATLALVPATLAGAALGLTLWNARRTARRGGRADVDTAAQSRVLLGAALAGGLFLAALVLLAGVEAGHAALVELTRAAPDTTAESTAPEVASEDAAERRQRTRPLAHEAMDDMLDFVTEGSGSLVSDAEVLWVHAISPPCEDPVLYLRHLVLDRLAPEGIVASDRRAPARRLDADDGARDGWVQLGAAPAGVPVHTFTIEARPLTLAARGWTILPLPTPALSVALEPVRYSPDGPAVVDGLQRRAFTYECTAGLVRTTRRELEQRPCIAPGSAARGAAGRYLELPAESPALRVLARHARRATRGADTDVERVLALAAYLQAFDYSLESSGFRGVDALADFVERRRGHCTEFAGAAMVMLRLSGVPARVAVGFTASRAPDGGWVARERNAHAWLEVPFEGLGWLTFDPTPSIGRADGEVSRWTPLDDEPPPSLARAPHTSQWLAEVADAWGAWIAGDLGLAAALRSGADALPRGSALAALVLAAALAAATWLLRRRPGRPGGFDAETRPAGRPATVARDLHARLSADLREQGHPRPRSVTLASHAEALVQREHAPEMLPGLVQWAYRERYGPGLDATEIAAVQALTASASERMRAGYEG